MNVAIEIVSDFVCPWCFIGKTHLAAATLLVRENHPQTRFQFNWLPYFLNPGTPPAGEPYRAFLETKFGGARQVAKLHETITDAGREAGIEFDFARIATRPNTLRAHRLIYRAQSLGHRPADIEALVDALFRAHFQRGEDIGNVATLAAIAAKCGDRKADVTAYLESDADVKKIRSLAGKVGGLGIDSVPYFILQRRLTVAGAQTAVVLAAAIMQAMPQ